MNKKIKIIDIFNIISKGDYEALPLNIQVDGNKYNWDNLEHFYGREDREYEDLLELAREYDTITFLDMIAEVLDDSVEDNTEEIEEYKGESFEQLGYEIGKMSTAIVRGLIKAVNEMEKTTEKEHCCCCGVEITNENRALHNMCNECKYGIDWEDRTK